MNSLLLEQTSLRERDGACIKQSLEAALAVWREELAPDQVLSSPEELARYGMCTGTSRQTIVAVLLPRTSAEVAGIVKVADAFRIPLYPISTGRNWGYGSANPVSPGCVIVDLSRLDRIVDFDPELGLVTLEPGVTQQQLADYLDRHDYRFMVPTTGAGPTCSIVGNALERGYGITPFTDHFGAVTSIEAVLPNGRTYRPALSELGADKVERAFKWGLGPYLDGLFAQGGFGIVTQMTIALARIPEGFQAFFFNTDEDAGLENLVDATQKVLARLPGIAGAINLMNRHRMLAMTASYPKALATQNGILPNEVVARLGREHRIAAWTGVGALYGEPQVVSAAANVVRKILEPATDQLLFMTPAKAALAARVASIVPGTAGDRLRRRTGALGEAIRIMLGRPSEVALQLAYWKSGGAPKNHGPLNPARDGCGLIWYPPLVPMQRNAVRQYVTHVMTTCVEHSIEPLITLTALSDRCFDSSVPLLFDRHDTLQVQSAEQCYQALFEGGLTIGVAPYRLGPQAMRRVSDSSAVCWDMVGKLKAAIDPLCILAPGRYAPL